MKKSEWFVLFAGIIGFVADFITITLFFEQRAALATSNSSSTLVNLQALVIFTMIYGWFFISWVLVRKHWVKASEKGSKRIKYSSGVLAQNALSHRVAYTVSGIGLFILPFSMRLPISDRIPARDFLQWFTASLGVNLLALALVGFMIFCAINFLMPIVYDDLSNMFESGV
jgi:hypothetical protein